MSADIFLASLSLGLLATTNPCVLPLYPGFLAYLSGNSGEDLGYRRFFLGFFVLAGVLTMMVALGGLLSALAISIGRALSVFVPLADILIFVLGVMLLCNRNPFQALPQLRVPLLSHPFANAFVYGLLYGPITLPCSGPLVVGVFAFSLTAGEVFNKLLVFLWFGLGFGLPLLALSFLSSALQRWLTRQFARRARSLNIAGGVLLIGIAIYDLAQNWLLISAFF
jgi:cytochrome c-type biogenesis protein